MFIKVSKNKKWKKTFKNSPLVFENLVPKLQLTYGEGKYYTNMGNKNNNNARRATSRALLVCTWKLTIKQGATMLKEQGSNARRTDAAATWEEQSNNATKTKVTMWNEQGSSTRKAKGNYSRRMK